MSGLGYVPSIIHEKFGSNPAMREDIDIYGSLRKHGGDCEHSELVHLFDTIQELRKLLGDLRLELIQRESYTESLEKKLAEVINGR